jgi:hypothetical protein
MVRQVTVPAAARARSTLSRIDYEDAFLVETGLACGWTGERWARASLEGLPLLARRELSWGWLALGLKHSWRRSDRFVLGWEVRRSGPEFALLGADSRLGMPAELLFEPRCDGLLFATFVQHGNPMVRAMWAAIAPVHVQVVPRVLGRAARRAGVGPGPGPGRSPG